MRKFLLIIILGVGFFQCREMFEGEWWTQVQNLSDHEIIFMIDLDNSGRGLRARNSYNDPAEYSLQWVSTYPPKMENHDGYMILVNPVYIEHGDEVSVYAFHPDTVAKYSWEELKAMKNYWFARVVIPGKDEAILFPFELND